MQKYVDYLLISILAIFKKVLKKAAIIAYKLALAQQEIAKLKAINKAAMQ
jgi:hypothetical protein